MRRARTPNERVRRRGAGRTGTNPPQPPPPARPLPLHHPAALAAWIAAAGIILVTVSYRIIDTDFWQHLAVGRAMWTTRTIPHTQVWTWPTWGAPDVLPSWLFRALLWPFWQVGGMTGLFTWRWLTTLAAFGFAWAAARRMGARGLAPLLVLVCGALTYRQRSQVRPETLSAVLFTLTLWLLETRRAIAGATPPKVDRTWALVGVALVWANAHISYFLLFILLGIHLLDAHVTAWRHPERGSSPGGLWRITLACVAVSFLNPFGWRALWQPFDFFLHWRDTAMFQGIGELRRLAWDGNERNGVFLLMGAWPLLLLWRWRRQGFDLAETLTCVFFSVNAWGSQRFVSVYALAAAPYLARDLDLWVSTRRWPRWSARPVLRAGFVIAACLALAVPEWLRPHSAMSIGVGMDATRYPIAACDFMAAHGVKGRGFNQVRTAGYLLWRFWPDRERLPFVSIHPEGSPADIRALYAAVFTDANRWADVDARFHFDYVLLDRRQYGNDHLYDHLDADSTWALVFSDDAALLYVRRAGPLQPVGERFGYHVVRGANPALAALRAAWVEDPELRARARAELERQADASPFNSGCLSLLADLAISERRMADARALIERALRSDPTTPHAHERLGFVAMWERDPARAIREYQLERRQEGTSAALETALGFALETAGDTAGARRHYQAALRLAPMNTRALERLEALDRAIGH